MITILGPTATGKTTLAANIAYYLNSEIISADSRQVYKGMDLGTGKDYSDYIVKGKNIPYHLIDIINPGYEYNVYEYQKDFLNVYQKITSRDIRPILCGGTGMYLEAVLGGYKLIKVPENTDYGKTFENKNDKYLIEILKEKKELHNVSDTSDRKRLIRALEIREYYDTHPEEVKEKFPKIESKIFGIKFERQQLKERITKRLKTRLNEGMIDEVKNLLDSGITPEQLKFYGLEYKFLTQFVTGEIDHNELFSGLNIAIHQFSKRQMTWFRRMEKKGFLINWIDGNLSTEEKVRIILSSLSNDSHRMTF
ncbi:MAG: tRNA (adenosine(37)-N6)-dimethylallyltransferase MiaA [Bacteroidales bacterium]|nr:tRNA (adenosine(37)-N6)-dimethylallyltransferase MiaA [Bacteroidales bacterium]